MNTKNNEGPQPWIDPALEARIVAGVLGETSAFEAAELDRVLAENPELAIFKRRIEAVHALVGAATRPEAPKIQLSPTRRQQLLEKLGGRPKRPKKKVFVLPRPFWWSSRNLIAVAASLVIGAIGVAFFGTMVVFQSKQEPADFVGGAAGFAAGGTANVPPPPIATMPPVSAPVNSFSMPASTAPTAPMPSTAIPNVVGGIGMIAPTRAAGAKQPIVQQPQEMAQLERSDRSGARKAAPEFPDQFVAAVKMKGEQAEAQDDETGGPVDRLASSGSSIARNRGTTAAASLDQVGPDSAGPSSKPESPAGQAADGLTEGRASAIKKFTGTWGKGIGSGTVARGGVAKDEDRKPAAQDASDLSAPGGAALPMEVAKEQAADGEEKRRVMNQPGKPGFVTSPATPEAGSVDESGFPPATEVKTVAGEVRAVAAMDEDKKASGDKSEAAPVLGDPPARQSLQEAREFYASGRYDLAAKRYEQVLSADPNDIAARRGMEQVNGARTKYKETAFTEARGDMARQVNNSWDRPVRKFDATPPQKNDQPLNVTHGIANATRKIDEITAAKQPFSTFSLHVSDVSFQLAKDALARGTMPDPDRIRAEEFYNAFDYGDPAPAPGEEVACRIEQCAHPFLQQRDLVRIALKVAAAGRAAGQPLRLTILLDTSGSMEREDRAASVRRALEVLATLLGPNDRVTLVGFARTPRLLAEQVPGDQANKLAEIAARTPSEGGTNLELALSLASELALKQKLPAAQNRIVLLTDGAANLGDANPARLARQIEKTRQQGISFDACGVGANGLNDEILEALTRKGDGRYYFLNKPEDADAGFARQLAGALRPAAENVKVQVVFNPARVSQYRLIGFEKHLLKKEDFRNDKVQAAELSAEEAGVAVYQVQTLPEGEGELGEVFVRFRDPANGQMVEHSWTMPYDAKAPAFDKAAPSMQLAATAALLAEKLRGDSRADLNALVPVITNLRGQYPHQAKVADLIRMFEKVRQ